LERHLAQLALKYAKPKTRQSHISAINGLLTTARQHDWEPRLSPSAQLYREDNQRREEPLPRFLSEAVMVQLEDPANLARFEDPTGRLLARILMATGLRISDGAGLAIDCLIRDAQETRTLQIAVSLDRHEGRHAVTDSFESYDPMRDPSMRPSPFQAYVRIQIGCDKFCTYCIVPSVRGPEQGRHPEQIAAEVRQLADEGCKEITLLGQTVNSYRYELGDGRQVRLSDLLAKIHDTPGIERIKFVTNFPKDMTDDLLQAVRDLPKVGPYLHVPAQSGCDDVLKRMKRLYSVAYYKEMLARSRETIPGVAISSDFIVGFSGESDESFRKTCDLVAASGFKNSFIFKYSPRPGTKGHELYEDDIPEDVKRRRNNDVLAIQNQVSLDDHRRKIGSRVRILVEGPSSHGLKQETPGPIQLTGRTESDHIVVFDGNPRLTGQFVECDIDDATSFTLFGTVVTNEQIAIQSSFEERAWNSTQATGRRSLPIV